jgi:hypothetical protein
MKKIQKILRKLRKISKLILKRQLERHANLDTFFKFTMRLKKSKRFIFFLEALKHTKFFEIFSFTY